MLICAPRLRLNRGASAHGIFVVNKDLMQSKYEYQTTARVISFDNTDKPSWVCGDKQTNHSQYHFVWQCHLSTLAHTPASTLNVNCTLHHPPSRTNAPAIAYSSGAKQTAYFVRADKAGIRMAHLPQYKCPEAVAM